MPTEERGSIGSVKPSGWHLVKYDIVDGSYLYNRCHLIAYRLAGENANERNLITGTRYLNVEGMLPFENMVADYVQETGNHVLYRVTPIFQGTELVARGVQMEPSRWRTRARASASTSMSIMTSPASPSTTLPVPAPWRGMLFQRTATQKEPEDNPVHPEHQLWKISSPLLLRRRSMKEENRQAFSGSREELIAQRYSPCGQCKP